MTPALRLLLAGLLLAACSGGAASEPSSAAPSAPPPDDGTFHGRRPAGTMSWRGADWLVREERESEEDPEAMLDALGLEAGDDVADIGTGVGFHALRMAPRVAPGRVYATDIQPEMLAMLRDRAAAAGADNVVPVRASQASTGLPEGEIELALMVDVYHELDDPGAVLEDLARALDPEDGRLALVEFRAEDPDVPILEDHKMSAAQMLRELQGEGWSLDRRVDSLPWQHLMLFRPPE